MRDPSDDNQLNSSIYLLTKQAILFEENYKEMLLQGDEVDLRIQLWKDAIEICKVDTEST
jgi:hypothetical protein